MKKDTFIIIRTSSEEVDYIQKAADKTDRKKATFVREAAIKLAKLILGIKAPGEL